MLCKCFVFTEIQHLTNGLGVRLKTHHLFHAHVLYVSYHVKNGQCFFSYMIVWIGSLNYDRSITVE